MALDILKKFIPGIREHGVVTDVNGTWTGTHTFSGTHTLSGTTNLSGTTTISGAVSLTGGAALGATTGQRRAVTAGTSATYSPAAADSGMVYIATKTSSTQTYTLPSAATAGMTFTFICGHADGEILITPAASQSIVITTFAAVGADADTGIVAPAAGTGIKNTAATNAIGDSVTLVSDGTATWYGVGITSGIWASQ